MNFTLLIIINIKMTTKTETKTKISPNLKLDEPKLYKVIYINDDVTTMDFVIKTLINHFNYSNETAHDLTHDIHEYGSATVAVLPYEIAEQKGIEITLEAREKSYPLMIKIEQE